MKAICFYFLVLFLIIAPCNGQPNEQQSNIQPKIVPEITTKSSDTTKFDGTNCYEKKQIRHETAYIWQGAWTYYMNHDLETGADKPSAYSSPPKIFFESRVMKELYDEIKDEENQGVLISYVTPINPETKKPSTGPPGLAIQNMVDCRVVPDGKIFSTVGALDLGLDGDLRLARDLIDATSLKAEKNNWKQMMTANPYVYSMAEGYMYSWDSLKSDSNDATKTGMSIRYGLRTLGLGEQEHFTTIKKKDTTLTGSVVYVNVLYFGNFEGEFGKETMLLDFAKPCPTFCNQL